MSSNLSEGWRRLGCTVEEFFYGTHMGKSWDDKGLQENKQLNQRLLATAKRLKAENRLDLIFGVIYDDVLEVETARELRKLNVPMVNYHVDLVGQWYRILQTGKYFDRVACAQEDHWRGLRRAGIRPHLMPMAANPPPDGIVGPTIGNEFEGVLYLGSPWLHRCEVLANLAQFNIPLRIYGHNWVGKAAGPSRTQPRRKTLHDIRHYLLPRVLEEGRDEFATTLLNRTKLSSVLPAAIDRRIDDCIKGSYKTQEFVPLVRAAAINLGFTHFSGTPGTRAERRQVRLREFEIPMAGGFYLTQDCPQLRKLFKPGCNVATWDTLPELREKVHYYLGNPAERQRIACEQQEHCLRHHTWVSRFADLLRELNMAQPEMNGRKS